ncbi:ABC transporter substrate-binding protein [Pseudothauera nasutitermitis]|uniref:ABC transporter substrate-binding protein n=1 Tax=Pseudothauera nasutitermitis TaxID=2565930 RepID=A0A4V3WBW4_9RHOO|nr:PhnD/SsuA/transferrin family substrate-binding protein [Pseudothauera nasutitermitis]THF64739.1 ABC transporter substrate-binding protein [Pseudothauera nasutitermitis]
MKPRLSALRTVLPALFALCTALAGGPAQAEGGKLPRLVLAGPAAAVSFPLVRMADSGALADLAEQVDFVLWRDPDQLRVMALEGRTDVLAMPTNVAANLYNRGAKLRLANVSTWGILWLVSRSAQINTLADLKGEEIAMPFRADMPDIVFGTVAERQGLDPRKDFRLRYVATPMDAMQLLIARRVDHALLAEPAVSMALRKTKSFPIGLIAPALHRALDLQAEWGRVLNRSPRMPQAGIAVMGARADDAAFVERIQNAYAEALRFCQDEREACARAVAARIELLSAEAVADALAVSPLEAVPASQARAELEFFYGVLAERNPALIGGRLPDDGFYAPGVR